MYTKRIIPASIHSLQIIEDMPHEQNRPYPRYLNSYIEYLEDKGLPDDAVTCIIPNKVVDYPKKSSFWLKSLLILFEEDANDPPNGVELIKGEWIINTAEISPCGECKRPFKRGCKCLTLNR